MSADSPNSPEKSRAAFPNRRVMLILMSILTLPYVLGLLFTVLFSFTSLLVYPGELTDIAPWVGFLAYCTSPIPFVLGIFGGWLALFLKRYRLALILAMLPLIETALFVIAYAALDRFLQ